MEGSEMTASTGHREVGDDDGQDEYDVHSSPRTRHGNADGVIRFIKPYHSKTSFLEETVNAYRVYITSHVL